MANKMQCSTLTCTSLCKPATYFEKLLKDCTTFDSSHEFCFVFMDFTLYELHAQYVLKTLHRSGIEFVETYHTIPRLTKERLHAALPKDCQSLILKCRNMVGTDIEGHTENLESFDDNFSMSCALIPRVPGMTSHRFSIGSDMFNPSYSELLELQANEKIKLIVLTGHGLDKESPMDYTLKCIAKEQSETFCYVNVIQPEFEGENHKEPNRLQGVVFTGDTVHAASVVIAADDFCVTDREAEIKKLKSDSSPCHKDRSLALVFVDEKAFRHLQDVTFLVHKHFPGTPLVGMDATKVISHEHLGPQKVQPSHVSPKVNGTNKTSVLSNSSSSRSLVDLDEPPSIVLVLLWWDQ